MPDTVVAALITKAKLFGGPIVGALLFGASLGWYAHGERNATDNLAATVARLDSSTVKRPEFDRALIRLEAVAVRQDSTNALLRRFICRASPTVCP